MKGVELGGVESWKGTQGWQSFSGGRLQRWGGSAVGNFRVGRVVELACAARLAGKTVGSGDLPDWKGWSWFCAAESYIFRHTTALLRVIWVTEMSCTCINNHSNGYRVFITPLIPLYA